MQQLPKKSLPIPMIAALDVIMGFREINGEWHGYTSFYFDTKRVIRYEQRTVLKTKEGTIARQRRETVQYLKNLRDQIDDVLSKIEDRQINEHDLISIESFAYKPRE